MGKSAGVKITSEIRRTVERASRNGGGGEVCGFLMQNQQGGQQFCLVRNMSPDKGAFLLDELDFERVLRRGAELGLRPLAFIHTHTTGPRLSQADKEGQAAISLPWVVVVVPKG